MRLWSVHPKYLDARGLVALWREGLLAQAVLRGRTTVTCITLSCNDSALSLRLSARSRTIFARSRGGRPSWLRVLSAKDRLGRGTGPIGVTRGQLEHEWLHLMAKLAKRDPETHARLESVKRPQPHPIFRIVPGGVETWEKGADRCPTSRARPSAAADRG